MTIPKRVREVLRLSPGDCVEFDVNTSGEIVVHKARVLPVPPARRRDRVVHPRLEGQMRRRAAELVDLLRGLD